MSGGVQRIWGSRNYDVRANLQLGGGGAGAGAANSTPPAGAAAGAAAAFADGGAVPGGGYTPEKAVAELVALNPHASAIGLSAQVRERDRKQRLGGASSRAPHSARARARRRRADAGADTP